MSTKPAGSKKTASVYVGRVWKLAQSPKKSSPAVK
jgi:hypothetical protein